MSFITRVYLDILQILQNTYTQEHLRKNVSITW